MPTFFLSYFLEISVIDSKTRTHLSTNNKQQTNNKAMSSILQIFTTSSTINSEEEVSWLNILSNKVNNTTRLTAYTSIVVKTDLNKSTSDKSNPNQKNNTAWMNNANEHMGSAKENLNKDDIEKTKQRMTSIAAMTDALSSTLPNYPGVGLTAGNNKTAGGHKSGTWTEHLSTGEDTTSSTASNSSEGILVSKWS